MILSVFVSVSGNLTPPWLNSPSNAVPFLFCLPVILRPDDLAFKVSTLSLRPIEADGDVVRPLIGTGEESLSRRHPCPFPP